MTKCNAFTLIELLVSVALIAVLASLLLPVVARAKQASYRPVCLNNAKQWSIAMNSYLEETEHGYLPKENAASSFNSWINVADADSSVWYNALPMYLSRPAALKYAPPLGDPAAFYAPSSMFHCPAARFQPNNSGPQFSMAMNSKLISADNPLIRPTDVLDQARTPYFIESGVPGEQKIHPKQSAYNGQPHAYASRFSGRHGGGGTISFADSHAVVVPGYKVVEMNPGLTNCGKAIFPSKEINWCADPSIDPNAP